MKHPLHLIHITSTKHKLTGKSRPHERPQKIIAVKKTPMIQRPELQEVTENINTGSVP